MSKKNKAVLQQLKTHCVLDLADWQCSGNIVLVLPEQQSADVLRDL
jgi:hypothetical protein